jgi:hypothetical protein
VFKENFLIGVNLKETAKSIIKSPGELAKNILGGGTAEKTIKESEELKGGTVKTIMQDTKSFIAKTLKMPGTLLSLPIDLTANLTKGILNIITNTWDKVGTVMTGITAIPAAVAAKGKSWGHKILNLGFSPFRKITQKVQDLTRKIAGASPQSPSK